MQTAILPVVILAVALVVGYAGWSYTQRQYYVGATDSGNVAIYRGVAGSLAGVRFSSVESTTDLRVDEVDGPRVAQVVVREREEASSENGPDTE